MKNEHRSLPHRLSASVRIKQTIQHWLRLSVANQIALAFALVYIPTLLIGAFSIQRLVKEQLVKAELRELKAQGLIVKTVIDEWEDSVLSELRVVANAYREGLVDPDSQKTFRRLTSDLRIIKSGNVRIVDISGLQSSQALQKGGASIDGGQQQGALSGDQVLPALLAERKNWLVNSGAGFRQFTASYFHPLLQKHVVFTAWPIDKATAGAQPTKFAVFTVPVEGIIASTKLESLGRLLLADSAGANDRQAMINRRFPSVVLTGSDGRLLLSFSANGKVLPHKEFNADSPSWKQVKSQAVRKCSQPEQGLKRIEQCQAVIGYAGKRYILNYSPDDVVDSGVGTITTLPLDLVSERVRRLGFPLLLVDLAMLGAGILAMHLFARKLAAPIDDASRAINKLSHGDFDIALSAKPIGELRHLFASINETAGRLKTLLASEKEAAVSLREIETAKGIQSNFLPEAIYVAEKVDLAALCEPAMRVGADWYDVIPLRSGTVFVLADVCDKGVGSALFMSVFRSLIRFFVQEVFGDQFAEGSSDQQRLQQVVAKVNEYMALNHGESSMFATIFLALHRPDQQKLQIVNAGHEATMLLADGCHGIQRLASSGPAVGIFPGASYRAYELDCPQGSWILMYSDGLPDSRNAEGLRFGDERSESCFLAAIAGASGNGTPSADAVLQRIRADLADFCDDEPAFDDLTMMVVHCLGEPAEAPAETATATVTATATADAASRPL